ncbi:hypothetical protein AVEN_199434-1 [Araneus ventricosus]|uniref:RNase H type-1 domain-containing protein n=1 Tax=Araneus ventricosus TaxID=182803 RepID=A0A4Y2M0I2_ARAVE|nr:hypothetical protein AVEN_199434-1 [Araneus ventricosus]
MGLTSFSLKMIRLADGGPDSLTDNKTIQICTDGSKAEEGVGAAFCVFQNKILHHERKGQLTNMSTAYQAELPALKEVVIYATEFLNK